MRINAFADETERMPPGSTPTLMERAGDLLGRVIAPVFGATTRARHARTFHPRGDLAFGEVDVAPDVAPHDHALAIALSGNVLVRFSSALFRGVRWPDVLGCALRFERPGAGVQDLLFATIKRPWTMPFAPFTTRVADYFANDYFAVSPFSAPGLPWIWLRLHPDEGPPSPRELSRRELLQKEIDEQRTLVLQASASPWGPWVPFLRLTLRELLADDPPGFEFDPFLDDRGLVPRGFVHALRRGAYQGSRAGRLPSVPAGLRR